MTNPFIKPVGKFRVPGFDFQNPRALDRAAASVKSDTFVQSGTRKCTRISQYAHQEKVPTTSSGQLEPDVDRMFDAVMKSGFRLSVEQLWPGIEWEMKHVRLDNSAKIVGIGQICIRLLNRWSDITPSSCPAPYNLAATFETILRPRPGKLLGDKNTFAGGSN